MSNITQSIKSLFSKNKVLIFALVVSLLFHFLLFSKFYFSFPKQTNNQQTLNVRLANVQSKQKTSSKPNLETSTSSLNIPKPLKTQPPLAVANEITEIVEKSLELHEEPLMPTETTPIPALQEALSNEQEIIDITDHAAISNEPLNSAEQELIEATKVNATQPYKYVETEFEITQNNELHSSGIGRTIFNLDNNQTYTLISTIQTNRPTALNLNILRQTSEGIVTENGLVPSYYSSHYSNEPSKAKSARFFWPDGALLLQDSKSEKTEPLNADTQDLLSFMYQFMFAPPKNNGEITVTNGVNSQSITYTSLGEEVITSNIGELKTIHLLINSLGQIKTEIWLAIDYQYLPIKIRKTLNNGLVIEENAVSIYTPQS